MSQPQFKCPFCGGGGKRSKEHVWAQWLRGSRAAKALLATSHGERIKLPKMAVGLDGSGRFEFGQDAQVSVAEPLPHVTVPVCEPCNNEWMARLEDRAKAILLPFRKAGWPVRLSLTDLECLATWATKSWMAYALLKGEPDNPFTQAEYRQMASSPAPLARSRVWLLHSNAPFAQVGLGEWWSLMSFDGPPANIATAPNNYGYAYLAVAGLVLFVVLAPEDNPLQFTLLEPEHLLDWRTTRAWPPVSSRTFPDYEYSAAELRELLSWPEQFFRNTSLPIEGLTPGELGQMHEEFQQGREVLSIRAKWDPTSLAKLERERLKLDPAGYGKTTEPYKILGGIDWHGERYDEAVAKYQTALANGASLQQIGSQLCDALMYAGRYAEAKKVSNDVMEAGPNEWRDYFRDSILHEVVDELGITNQKRQVRQFESTSIPKQSGWRRRRKARTMLRRADALDPLAWFELAEGLRRRARMTQLVGAAYLGRSEKGWLAVALDASHRPAADELRKAAAEGLATEPSIVEALTRTAKMDLPHAGDLRSLLVEIAAVGHHEGH